MRTLDIGCGKSKIKNAIGVDIQYYNGVDILMDLEKLNYPFKNETFDLINCDDILEHLNNLTLVLEELHRILKKDGQIRIRVPHFSNFWAFTDPTHKRFFAYKTLEYYCGMQEENCLNLYKIKSRKITFGSFFKIFEKLFNKFPNLYENRFAFIIQAYELHIILEKKS